MRIVSTPKNHFSKLKEIEVKVKNKFIPIEERQRLALEAAKLVLPIWEVYYKDDRPHLAIQAVEKYLNNPTKKNEKKVIRTANIAYYAADAVTTDAAHYAAYAAAYAAYSVNYSTYTVDYAIKATKLFFKIK